MNASLAALAAALILAAPIAAAADVPSYALATSTDQQLQGRIADFDGGYDLHVRDANGYVDNVQLHAGTIINPTGLTLAPGMVVSIIGFNSGSFFDANEIDTPYVIDAGVPFYAGHPWDYYGASIGLDFFFGSSGAPHAGAPRVFATAPIVRVDNTVRLASTGRQNVTVERTPATPRSVPNETHAALPASHESVGDRSAGESRPSGDAGHERR